MKKIIAIAAIFMLVPFTALALQPMNDSALQDVTAQSGVSIDIDNIQLDFAMDYLAWGDADGIDDGNTGWVGIAGLIMTNIVIDRLGIGNSGIDPIAGATPDSSSAYFGLVGPSLIVDGAVASMTLADLSYLTIDVGYAELPNQLGDYDRAVGIYDTDDDGTNDVGDGINNHTAVAIGIPTISIYVGKIADMDIALGSAATALNEVLGTVAVGGMQVDLKAGAVYIMAHDND